MKYSETAPARVVPGMPNSYKPMQRLAQSHRAFDEAFLQQLLADHPELLPVSEIRDDIGRVVLIGREIHVSSGYIDNLYLSTEGCPVLVETKLFRNPEARREVLSQTLDYVKDLVAKDYEWFAEQWKKQKHKSSEGETCLLDSLNAVAGDLIEEEFIIDRVHRFLARGEVVALIVGDGIQSRLKELVDHVCKDTPHLRYSLGLVEIACYEDPSTEGNELLVVPRVRQHIEPVERASVRIDLAEQLEGKITVSPSVALPESTKSSKSRVTMTEEDFLSSVEANAGKKTRDQLHSFYQDLLESFDLYPDFKSSSLMIKVQPPSDEFNGVSVLGLEKRGAIYNTAFFNMFEFWGVPKEVVARLASNYWGDLNAIDDRFSLKGKDPNTEIIAFDQQIVGKLAEIKKCTGKMLASVHEALQQAGDKART
jgi:hypothetical protein